MALSEISNRVTIGSLGSYQLRTILSLFTRHELRLLAKRYNITQRRLKGSFVHNLVRNRDRFNDHVLYLRIINF